MYTVQQLDLQLVRYGWQARTVGDELVVGLVPDREIRRCKGPPVQNEEERKIMVEAVKWVGEVITGQLFD